MSSNDTRRDILNAKEVADELVATAEATQSNFRFLDVPGLANYLGTPKSWVYDRTGESSGDRIPHFKFGKYIRFDIKSEEFKAWLKKNFKN